MITQGTDSLRFSGSSIPYSFNKNSKSDLAQNSSSKDSLNLTISSESYSSKSISFDLKSKDGDTVSFSFQSIEFQKTLLQVGAEGKPEDLKEMINFIKDQLKSLSRGIWGSDETEGAKEVQGTDQLQIPEYWNAENTSQRIVDFSVSFYGKVNLKGDEFINAAKSAIEEGFKQAKEILGNLSDPISKLINDTYELAMKKLDSWAQENGLKSDVEQVVEVQS